MHMYYTFHIMNLKINIWTLNFFFQIWKLFSKLFKTLFEFQTFGFEYAIFNLNSKRLISSKDIWILN
jgi:hypothetical protein